MNLKVKKINSVEVGDWDDLVKDTYKRPYSLQQQDGCMERGHKTFTVPCVEDALEFDSYMHDSIPEVVNGNEVGVKFAVWLKREPKTIIKNHFENGLFWIRNFYPNLDVVANDLYSKGLIEAGEYLINIDW